LEPLGVIPLVHDVDNLIDKAIETDEGAHPAGAIHAGEEARGGLFTKLFRLRHGGKYGETWEKLNADS
jgi:hypothetical protein